MDKEEYLATLMELGLNRGAALYLWEGKPKDIPEAKINPQILKEVSAMFVSMFDLPRLNQALENYKEGDYDNYLHIKVGNFLKTHSNN